MQIAKKMRLRVGPPATVDGQAADKTRSRMQMPGVGDVKCQLMQAMTIMLAR